MKFIRLEITTVIPTDSGTQEEIEKVEDDMLEALGSIGARVTGWKTEIEDEEDD